MTDGRVSRSGKLTVWLRRAISAIAVGVVCLAATVFCNSFSSPAFAGKGGTHGSNHAGGNGGGGNGNAGGNGNGNGGGNGLGNAYGQDDGGGPSILDAPGNSVGATGDINGAIVEPLGQDKHNNPSSHIWDAATKTDPDLHIDKLKDLGAIKDKAADYLGEVDFPGKANPPGLTGEKPEQEAKDKDTKDKDTKDKDTKVKDTKVKDPKGEAVGLERKEASDDTTGSVANEAQSSLKPPSSKALRIELGQYSPREVLAVNLSAAALERVRALGFSPGVSTSLEDGGSIAVLSTPVGVDALVAIRLLRRELPGENFQLNRIYSLYRPAMKDDLLGQRTRPARSGVAAPCEDDHCYAQDTILWQAQFATCAKGLRIGVIDTDIELNHPAFKDQRITHMRILPDGRQAAPNWHGTGVLAILAGRRDSGTPGLLPEANFFVASIFFAGENGNPQTDTLSLIRALEWMRASDVKLVNMSFTGPHDELIQLRLTSLQARGFVFVGAAGNGGPAGEPMYPAAYPQVIAVTAVDRKLQLFTFATRGPQIDLAAPGVRIWTAVPGAREGYRSGTSFAVPYVTAVLAVQPRELPHTPKEVLLDRLNYVHLGDGNGRNLTFGRGLVQAPRACAYPNEDIAHKAPISSGPQQ